MQIKLRFLNSLSDMCEIDFSVQTLLELLSVVVIRKQEWGLSLLKICFEVIIEIKHQVAPLTYRFVIVRSLMWDLLLLFNLGTAFRNLENRLLSELSLSIFLVQLDIAEIFRTMLQQKALGMIWQELHDPSLIGILVNDLQNCFVQDIQVSRYLSFRCIVNNKFIEDQYFLIWFEWSS